MTENYLASQFCLAEAGAAWISKNVVIPLVVPPFTRSRLSATLAVKQAWRINDDDDLNAVADDIRAALSIDTNHGQWGAEKKAFLKRIEEAIKTQVPPKIVDPVEHENLKKELSYSETSIESLRSQLDEKDKLISQIKLAKDAEDVRAIELSSLGEMEAFEELASQLTKAINDLPVAASEALYHHVRGESLPVPEFGYSDSDDKWREIRVAQQKNMLSEDGPFNLNDSHPKVGKAISALDRLSSFMNENEEVLRPLIEAEYEVTYSLGDEDFWNQFVG